jgi:hypothetical protein
MCKGGRLDGLRIDVRKKTGKLGQARKRTQTSINTNFMAKISQKPKIELEVTLTLTESEARALNALTIYGDKVFLNFFYEYLGSHYLKPHEAGLISLFGTVRKEIPVLLDRTDNARNLFNG